MPFRQMRGRFFAGENGIGMLAGSIAERLADCRCPPRLEEMPASKFDVEDVEQPAAAPPGGGLHLRVPQAARAGPPLGCGLIACDWNRPRRGRRAAASRRRRPAVRCRTWRALRRLQPELEYMPKRTRKALLILNFEFAAPRKEPPPPPFFEAKFSFSGQRYYLCRL